MKNGFFIILLALCFVLQGGVSTAVANNSVTKTSTGRQLTTHGPEYYKTIYADDGSSQRIPISSEEYWNLTRPQTHPLAYLTNIALEGRSDYEREQNELFTQVLAKVKADKEAAEKYVSSVFGYSDAQHLSDLESIIMSIVKSSRESDKANAITYQDIMAAPECQRDSSACLSAFINFWGDAVIYTASKEYPPNFVPSTPADVYSYTRQNCEKQATLNPRWRIRSVAKYCECIAKTAREKSYKYESITKDIYDAELAYNRIYGCSDLFDKSIMLDEIYSRIFKLCRKNTDDIAWCDNFAESVKRGVRQVLKILDKNTMDYVLYESEYKRLIESRDFLHIIQNKGGDK